MRRAARSSSSIGSRELTRLERELRRRNGAQIRELREDLGVTQAELARVVGVRRSHVARIESGAVGMSQATHLAIAAALGADLSVRLFPGSGVPIRDRFQAPIVESLIRGLDPSWTAHPETPVGTPRRRIIDVVLVRGRVAVACEVHSELRRVEAILRRAGETERDLADAGAAELTSRLLIVRSTTATRAVAREFAATLAAAYPARSVDAFEALTIADRSWPGAAILWSRVQGSRAELLRFPPRGVTLGR